MWGASGGARAAPAPHKPARKPLLWGHGPRKKSRCINMFFEAHVNARLCSSLSLTSLLGKHDQWAIVPLFGDNLNRHLLQSKYRQFLPFSCAPV